MFLCVCVGSRQFCLMVVWVWVVFVKLLDNYIYQLFVQNIEIMEAFILADRVLARTHLVPQRPKYLKRYDIPLHTSVTSHTQALPRRPLRSSHLLNTPKTKHLLKGLYLEPPQSCLSSPKLDKYFTLTDDSNHQSSPKTKAALLIKTLDPQPQHYDADFSSISKRAPCWKFMPERTRRARPNTTEEKPVRMKPVQRPHRARPFQIGELQEREEQRIEAEVRGREAVDPRLQYSANQLGRCTAIIFKKYKLEKDPYFKKFLNDIQHSA